MSETGDTFSIDSQTLDSDESILSFDIITREMDVKSDSHSPDVLVSASPNTTALESDSECELEPEPEPVGNEVTVGLEVTVDPEEWHTLSSIVPLLQLLPAFKRECGQYILSGSITAFDLALVVKTRANIFTTPSLFPRSLLPSLEKLTINMLAMPRPAIRELEHTFSVLFSPSIREMELYGLDTESERAILPLLASVPNDAPRLRKLVLIDADHYKLPSAFIKSVISDMTSLEYLEIDDVVNVADFGILEKIGELPQLITFVLRSSNVTEYSSPIGCASGSVASDYMGFKKLENLDVRASFEIIRDLIYNIGSGSLKCLEFSPVVNGRHDERKALVLNHEEEELLAKKERFHIPMVALPQTTSSPWAKILEEILQDIPTRWTKILLSPCLESLIMNLTDTFGTDRIFELPGTYLDPLWSLDHLGKLHVERWRISGCHATLVGLAPWLSELKCLSLPLGKYSSPIDVGIIEILAASFHELEFLQIPLSVPRTFGGNLTSGLSPYDTELVHPLRELSVGSQDAPQSLGTTMDAAGMIDTLFPRLESIQAHGGQMDDFWTEVGEFVGFAQRARRNERVRIYNGIVTERQRSKNGVK
ncbi:hypothetical protein BDQ17DRAFT_1438932 [Cyathus striatus]|nr:hypothetical protein BDQ17DRAFT_1438932 [Cyathus striatus]